VQKQQQLEKGLPPQNGWEATLNIFGHAQAQANIVHQAGKKNSELAKCLQSKSLHPLQDNAAKILQDNLVSLHEPCAISTRHTAHKSYECVVPIGF
jgi:hypothetical protein